MARPRRPFVGGNWKMNTTEASARALAGAVAKGVGPASGVDVAIYPPHCYLLAARDAIGGHDALTLGAQDAWFEPKGAFTGEISVAMAADCGARSILCGHSERRHVIGEDDSLINRKVRAVVGAPMQCVLCVGETLEQREAGETDAVNERQVRAGLEGVSKEQMAHVVIAYEPVWAIGTGKTATPDDAQGAHARIRGLIAELYDGNVAEAIRIIYGGSVKPDNAADLFAQPDIDGGLIGGASLDEGQFLAIVAAAEKA